MSLIVQKYGGSSAANPDKIRQVARRILEVGTRWDNLVAVVSAMGKTTDSLLALAHLTAPSLAPRELDALLATGEQVSSALLAVALQAMGRPA